MDTRNLKPVTTGRHAARTEKQLMPAHSVSPFAEMDLFFDRLSNGLLSRMGFPALAESGWPTMTQVPKVDLVDRGKELVLRAEIPGVSKDDLKITLRDGVVSIRGESRHETHEDEGDYHRREIRRGSFERAVSLPADVVADKAKASFRDGVLELVMPKNDKPSGHSIPIQ